MKITARRANSYSSQIFKILLLDLSLTEFVRAYGANVADRCIYDLFPLLGIESNARPSPACFVQRSQGIAKLEYHGAKDESYLSYDEPVQHGRVEEMPHWRVLGAHLWFGNGAELSYGRIGWYMNIRMYNKKHSIGLSQPFHIFMISLNISLKCMAK